MNSKDRIEFGQFLIIFKINSTKKKQYVLSIVIKIILSFSKNPQKENNLNAFSPLRKRHLI